MSIDALEATKHIWNKLTFHKLLKILRETDELTQEQLAKKIGVSKQFICSIETGKKEISIALAKKITIKMGYSPEPFVKLLIRDQLRKNKMFYDIEFRKVS